MNWRTLGLGVMALMAVALVGCGGGGAGPAAVSLTVEGSEFAFDPARVTIEAGQDVTVNFTNTGTIEHNWVLLDADGDISTGLVAAGGEGSVTFSVDQAGEYTVVCDVPGHREAGMEGTLIAS
ncbi:MAG: plastocyanin/azurin family copper-binding protein [Anaerolineae bacterium]